MGKVTMAKQSLKKTTRGGRSAKEAVPKAADLADAKVGSTKSKSVSDDKVHIYQVPFCDDGSVYGAGFSGKMVSLHLLHEYPSVWFLILQSLGAYCEFRHDADKSFPQSWKDLLECLNMKIVTTSPGKGQKMVSDEDDVGTFVKNRAALYCDLDKVKNIFCFLDGFVAWRVVTNINDNQPIYNQNPEIVFHVPCDSTLEFLTEDGMECTVHVKKDVEQTEVSAVHVYPPTWPPRFVIATISSESDSTVSIVFSGNTMPFAEAFDGEGIGKKRINRDLGDFPEWYRVCRGIDITDAIKKVWLLDVFGDSVLKHSPCFIRVETWPKKDDAFNSFMTELEALTSIYR